MVSKGIMDVRRVLYFPMIKAIRRIAFLAAFALMLLPLLACLPGCGYSLQGRVKPTFRPARGIFVPVFRNRTEELGAELIFTNALIRELQSRGEVVVTDRRPGALEFRGAVTDIVYGPTTNTDAGFKGLRPYRQLPTEIKVDAWVAVELIDPKTGALLWSGGYSSFRRVPMPLDRTFNFQAPSAVGPITQTFVKGQFPAIARDIARDIYDSMLEEEG